MIAIDLFFLHSENYLLIVDMYSKFPELCVLNTDTTTINVIKNIKSVFSRHGILEVLYTDNGPQFNNHCFQQFLRQWDVIHKTSSPRYALSNGFIERHVQTIKKILKKTIADKNKDMYTALLEYRNTPIDRSLPSPAELLFGRKIRGIIPLRSELLKPIGQSPKCKTMCKRYKNKQKQYDQRSKNLPKLSNGDSVMIQNHSDKSWHTGRVIKKYKLCPRAYVVQSDKHNNKLITNRRFLQKYDKNQINETEYETLLNTYLPTR